MVDESVYPIQTVKNVLATMRDGRHIAVDLIGPEGLQQQQRRFPAIIETNPYRKDDYSSLANPNIRRSKCYLASRGYVVIRADVRGVGGSEGASTDMYEPVGISDGYDLVEWAAERPWCTGDVGMFGTSWGAVHCYQVAMHQPPSLKAIVPILGTDEVYADTFYPGGALRGLFELGDYSSSMISTTFSPPDPDYSTDGWADLWKDRLEHNVPWILNWLEHQRDCDYWRSRCLNPDTARIRCPTFVVMGWNDRYVTSAFRVFSKLDVPKKLLIGPWQHDYMDSGFPGPRINHHHETARWFDRWLKGRDTGIMDEPPITLFVRRYEPPAPRRDALDGFWRAEEGWPPRRLRMMTLYASKDHGLGEGPPMSEGGDGVDSYEYDPSVGVTAGFMGGLIGHGYGLPLDQRPDEAHSLTYTSDPLDRDLELLGPVEARVYFSSTAGVTHVVAKVCDVAPDGSSLLITRGILNATHRESHTDPRRLEAGRVYEITLSTDPAAYIFPAGHRIRVDISSSDFPNVWPSPEPCTNSVSYGKRYPSRFVFPTAPPQDPALPAPVLIPSDLHPAEPKAGEKPTYLVTFDIPNRTATVRMSRGYNLPVDGRTSYESRRNFEISVSIPDPSRAVVKGDTLTRIVKPEMVVETTGTCVTRSSMQVFDVTAIVNVSLDGKQYFSKTWSRSFPRDHV